MAYINGNEILFSPTVNITHIDRYEEGYREGYIDATSGTEFVIDNTSAYRKSVPDRAQKLAQVLKLGGRTIKGSYILGGEALADKIVASIPDAEKDTVNKTVTFKSTNASSFRFEDLKPNTQYTVVLYGKNTKETTNVANIRLSYSDGSNSDLKFTTMGEDSYSIRTSLADKSLAAVMGVNGSGTTVLHYEKCGIFEGVVTEENMSQYFNVIRSAKVTAIESVGANLIPFPYADTTKTLNGITFTDNGDGSITINGTATNQSWFYISKNNIDLTFFEVGQTYSLSGGTDQVKIDILFQNVTWGGEKFTITEEMLNAPNINVEIRIKDGTSVSNVTIYPMINKGSTALPYAPYVRHALPIPEDVRPEHGINENVYDYIEWCEDGTRKKYKCIKVVDLSTMYWSKTESNGTYRWQASESGNDILIDYDNPSVLAEKYRTHGWSGATKGDITMDAKGYLSVYSDESPTGMVLYALANPEVTDISDTLPADNLIGVEGGGTITAVNEYGYDVPSTIQFVRKVGS